MKPGCHQPGDVGHIHHQISVHRFGNLAKCFKIYDTRVGACTCNNQLWPVLFRQHRQCFVVDGLSIPVYAVVEKIIKLS